eukprot:12174258-Alexandrium_andersonii.AAC.1
MQFGVPLSEGFGVGIPAPGCFVGWLLGADLMPWRRVSDLSPQQSTASSGGGFGIRSLRARGSQRNSWHLRVLSAVDGKQRGLPTVAAPFSPK